MHAEASAPSLPPLPAAHAHAGLPARQTRGNPLGAHPRNPRPVHARSPAWTLGPTPPSRLHSPPATPPRRVEIIRPLIPYKPCNNPTNAGNASAAASPSKRPAPGRRTVHAQDPPTARARPGPGRRRRKEAGHCAWGAVGGARGATRVAGSRRPSELGLHGRWEQSCCTGFWEP